MAKLYGVSVSILIQSDKLKDAGTQKVDWHDSRTYKFADANEREAFIERIEKTSADMEQELGVKIFQITGRFTEHAMDASEAVQDALQRFAHRHTVYEGLYNRPVNLHDRTRK